MSNFEKILLALLVGAKNLGPIFVHSNQGVAILNASESLVTELAQAFAAKPTGQ